MDQLLTHRKLSKILVVLMSVLVAVSYMILPGQSHAVSGIETTNNVDDLSEVYVDIDDYLYIKDAQFSTTNTDVMLIDNWMHVHGTDVNKFDKALVYYGKLDWGDANTSKKKNAELKANKIDGEFTFTWENAAHLHEAVDQNATIDADVQITLSNWTYRIGAMPDNVKASTKVYALLAGGHSISEDKFPFGVFTANPRLNPSVYTTALATTVANTANITIKVLEHGTNDVISEAQYPTTRFGFKDIDQKDYTVSSGQSDSVRYAGTYAESVALKDGIVGPVYLEDKTYLKSDVVGENQRYHGTRTDANSMISGFATGVKPQEFSYVWRGSMPAVAATDTSTEVNGHYPGTTMGTVIQSYQSLFEESDFVTVSYEWDGDHPDRNVPAGTDKLLKGSDYDVDITYKDGDTVEEDSTVWTFHGWKDAPGENANPLSGTLQIYENTIIYGSWTKEDKYNITTEVVNGTITEDQTGIPKGEDRTITYEPKEGYHIVSVTVDDKDVDPATFTSSYAFEKIEADHHIKVVYELAPALAIEKTPDKEVYNAGDTVNYTVTIKQIVEGAEARNVSVKDTIPAGLTLNKDSITGEGLTVVDAQDQSYELLIPSIKESYSYTYSAVTAEDADAEELTNVVTATAENTTTPVEARATVKSLTPKPTIEKTVSNATPVYGEEITYTIKVKEPQQGVVVRNAVVTDDIPAGVSYVNGSVKTAGDAATASVEGTKLTVKIPELANETTIQFKAKVTAKTGQVKNVAILTGDKIKEQQSETTITVKEPNPTLTKTVSPKKLKVGEYATFTLKVTSDVPLVNGQIVDKSPSNVVIDEDSVECSDDNIECSVEDNVLTAAYERLQGTVTITYEAKVKKAGSYTNVAVLTAENMKDGPLKADATVKATKKSKTAAASKTSKKSNGSGHSPKTGDPMNIWLFVAAMILAIVVGGGAVLFRRRKAATDRE